MAVTPYLKIILLLVKNIPYFYSKVKQKRIFKAIDF